MSEEIVMPRLSDSMEEGTILKWMKSVGDEVALGDELVEIETDKANMVFEADAAGTLVEIVADEGATLPIGEVIARVGEAGEADASPAEDDADSGDEQDEADSGGGDGGDPRRAVLASLRIARRRTPPPPPRPRPRLKKERKKKSPRRAQSPISTKTHSSPTQPAQPSGGDGRVKASPLARRIAKEKGVELAALSGSGPGWADHQGGRRGRRGGRG